MNGQGGESLLPVRIPETPDGKRIMALAEEMAQEISDLHAQVLEFAIAIYGGSWSRELFARARDVVEAAESLSSETATVTPTPEASPASSPEPRGVDGPGEPGETRDG